MIHTRTYTAIPDTAEKRQAAAQGGFSLIELLVVITVLAILIALGAGNWVDFAKYQSLRGDASALQKDLMALKARAVADSLPIKVTFANNEYQVDTAEISDAGTIQSWETMKNVPLQATVSAGSLNGTTGITPTPPSSNGWNVSGNGIQISPNNLEAFQDGWVIITNGKNQFCIMKNSNSIKPEVYHKKTTGTSWKKI